MSIATVTSRFQRLGLAVAAVLALSAAAVPRAQALSIASPGASPNLRDAAQLTTEVQHRGGGFHGGGGFRGGGFGGGGGFRGGGPAFHGGGFRGGGAVFHGGGGFRGGGAVFRGGGFRPAFHGGGVYRGGGFRYAPAIARPHYYAPVRQFGYRHHHRPRFYGSYGPRYYGYGPSYYYGPRRFCRLVFTHYGPRKICRYRPWHQHWRHHHRRFNVYW